MKFVLKCKQRADFWGVTWREIAAQAAEMCNAVFSYYRMKCHVQQLAVFCLMYLHVIYIRLGTSTHILYIYLVQCCTTPVVQYLCTFNELSSERTVKP